MTPRAYYNEFDHKVAAWLRELIARGLVAPGDVDERSITDVTAEDLRGYTQHHFFAGIGTWSYALRGAGWADGTPVWTGSCPCQPFSASGQQRGTDDQRHLWPAWFRLIRECRPDVVFGEQVASKAGLGWLDFVSHDLEDAGYAVGAADTSAAGVGAPHIRQRLYFVAESSDPRCEGDGLQSLRRLREGRGAARGAAGPGAAGTDGIVGDAEADGHPRDASAGREAGHRTQLASGSGLADAGGNGVGEHPRAVPGHEGQHGLGTANGDHAPIASGTAGDGSCGLADDDEGGRDRLAPPRLHERRQGSLGRESAEREPNGARGNDALRCCAAHVVGNADSRDATEERTRDDELGEQRTTVGGRAIERAGARATSRTGERIDSAGASRAGDGGDPSARRDTRDVDDAGGSRLEGHAWHERDGDGPRRNGTHPARPIAAPGAASFWADAEWIPCRDGKARPIEPGTFPLADGTPARVVRLRGYGNAIVAPQAQAFIEAYLDVITDRLRER